MQSPFDDKWTKSPFGGGGGDPLAQFVINDVEPALIYSPSKSLFALDGVRQGSAADVVTTTVNGPTFDTTKFAYSGTEGTWIFKASWTFNVNPTVLLTIGLNRHFIHQRSATEIDARDGGVGIRQFGTVVDGEDQAVAMSYKVGGDYDIIVNGCADLSASLAGNFDGASIDIGHDTGADQPNDLAIAEILWFPAQFNWITRAAATS